MESGRLECDGVITENGVVEGERAADTAVAAMDGHSGGRVAHLRLLPVSGSEYLRQHLLRLRHQ